MTQCAVTVAVVQPFLKESGFLYVRPLVATPVTSMDVSSFFASAIDRDWIASSELLASIVE